MSLSAKNLQLLFECLIFSATPDAIADWTDEQMETIPDLANELFNIFGVDPMELDLNEVSIFGFDPEQYETKDLTEKLLETFPTLGTKER